MSEQQKEILVCRAMNRWSHDQYLDAPISMIRSILMMLREEAENAKHRSN